MSGWTVASIVGGVVAAGLIALLVVVYKAVLRTAENARQLVQALEEVQANTIVLADLEAQSAATAQVVTDANWALQKLRQHEAKEDGHDPDGS